MFWWYWSLRQRLMLLAAVLLPIGGFFAFRVLFDDVARTESSVSVEDALPEPPAPKSELFVLADDDARSAARVFQRTFKAFGEGASPVDNIVFPGMAFDEYSVYLFYSDVVGTDDSTATIAPQAPVEDNESTSVPSVSAPSASMATTVETVLEGLRWHFTEREGVTRIIESREGVELFVTGLEGSRGYRGTLRFQAVPGGVVVRGVVKELPANEVNDIVADSQTPASGVAPVPVGSAESSVPEIPATTLPSDTP